jgi:sec-independent protein translocase protein TatA
MEKAILFLNFLGTGEFILIAFVFLLLFGPDKIPGIARNVGKGIRKIKDASEGIKQEIHASSNDVTSMASNMKKEMDELEDLTQSVKRGVKKTLDN